MQNTNRAGAVPPHPSSARVRQVVQARRQAPVRPTVIYVDGAAWPNPGPAAYAYVIDWHGQLIEAADRLGHATNNVAEYTALIMALERAAELGARRLLIRSDSELMVRQMVGEYRVRDPKLQELHQQAQSLCDLFASVALEHVPREDNVHADYLCNQALAGQ